MDRIRSYPKYKEVMIFKDYDIDGQQIYIGNGQGCSTFWFDNLEKVKKFIDKNAKKIEITDLGCINGLIPKKLCKNCKCYYSYGTKKWADAKDYNCKKFKINLISNL